MARTADPSRLRSDEAKAFRLFVREMRSKLGVNNADLADILGCSDYTIAAALRDNRGPGKPNPLLSGTAGVIFGALGNIAERRAGRDDRPFRLVRLALTSYRDSVMEEGGWMYRVFYPIRWPGVFVVPQDVDRFAIVLAESVCAELPQLRRNRALIVRAAARQLRRDSASMLDAWFNSVGTRVEYFIKQAIPKEKGWITDPPLPRRKRWKGRYSDPLMQKDPSLFAVEVLALVVDLYKPKSKKGTKMK